jgi:hypothetical protein
MVVDGWPLSAVKAGFGSGTKSFNRNHLNLGPTFIYERLLSFLVMDRRMDRSASQHLVVRVSFVFSIGSSFFCFSLAS